MRQLTGRELGFLRAGYHLDSPRPEHLTVDRLQQAVGDFDNVSIGFWGPSAYACSLLNGLTKYGLSMASINASFITTVLVCGDGPGQAVTA